MSDSLGELLRKAHIDLEKKLQDQELILRSIFEKWNPIALGCYEDEGTRDCPLCEAYYDEGTCVGCPIAYVTKQNVCWGTPYEDYENWDSLEEAFGLIEEEIEFLISLLTTANQENLEALHMEWCKKEEK